MKKFGMSLLVLSSILVLGACGSSEESAENTENDSKATAGVIAEKVLKEHYGLSDAKVDVTDDDFKVNQMPDDENADDGTEYKNVYSTIGDFENKGESYSFDMTYSLKDDDSFSVIYFYTPFDDSKTIDTPLKSEQ
ncbi:hypothetical protein [Enterococcus diestrammenae]|uniref:hypothetical protein n=1 Tax=Enterococcus diestrammenae TaxID=1155073 RepID=UPI00195DFE24